MKKKIKKFFKNNKNYLSVFFLFLIFMYSFSYVVGNNIRYQKVNDYRQKIGLTKYKENNLLVRTKTLENMKKDINNQLKKDYEKYIQLVKPSEEIQDKILKIYNSAELTSEEKVGEIKPIVKKDLLEKTDKLKSKIENKLNLNLQYNSKERQDLLNNQEKFEELSKTEDDSVLFLLEMYKELTNINSNIDTVNDESEKRIEESQKKAEEKKVAEEKKEAEEKKKAEEEKKAEENKKTEEETSDATNKNNDSYDSTTPNLDGNFDRANATALANAINAYRNSLGLSSYSYASDKQSCTDSEALAYAQTQNPHNWVCESANNENASYTAIGSDLVGITMDFFINDPPHEAPMSGNYKSIAVSVYQSDGMNYTIVDFFY